MVSCSGQRTRPGSRIRLTGKINSPIAFLRIKLTEAQKRDFKLGEIMELKNSIIILQHQVVACAGLLAKVSAMTLAFLAGGQLNWLRLSGICTPSEINRSAGHSGRSLVPRGEGLAPIDLYPPVQGG